MADSTIIVGNNISCPFPFPSFCSRRPLRLQTRSSCRAFCYILSKRHILENVTLQVSKQCARTSVPLDLINLVKQDILWYGRFSEDQYWPCDKVIRILNKAVYLLPVTLHHLKTSVMYTQHTWISSVQYTTLSLWKELKATH